MVRYLISVINLLATPICPLKQNLLEVWEDVKNFYLLIYQEVEKLFCIVMTLVPPEWLFSKA